MPQSDFTVRTPKKRSHELPEFPMLLEHYQVVGVIGEGGMGTVFKGRHLNLKRDVAIKTLRIDKISTSELVTRFRKEMELIGQMDHPNVVRATDAGERNGVFFLVMEFLPGIDLSTLVARKGALDVPQACELVRQAALGLDYVHQTLVHRDIKPSNLMLTANGQVKILDLGLACSSLGGVGDHEQTPPGCAIGTFSYMAPEQADHSHPIDGRADIYSLGCTLFKLLTGKAPFSGPEYESVAMQLYAHRHVPLSEVELFPQVPEKLRPLLLRMTAKDPGQRCATARDGAREVARELAAFAAGSRPVGLLDETIDGAVLPLPYPMPEELSLLTHEGRGTPYSTSEIATVSARIALPAPPASKPKRRWALAVGVAALLVALGGAGWHFTAAHWFGRAVAEKAPRPPLALDNFPVSDSVPLLDAPTMPIGHSSNQPNLWRFDPAREVLDVKGPGLLIYPLGTTSRTRFNLEAGIAQSPWTGMVGLFWGYHENAEIKAAKAVETDFAWFQVVYIDRRIGDQKENLYSARRARVALWHNAHGEVAQTLDTLAKHDLPDLDSRPMILSIDVQRNRIGRAYFGPVELTRLFSPEINGQFELDAAAGAVGVVSFGNSASFSKARFKSFNPN